MRILQSDPNKNSNQILRRNNKITNIEIDELPDSAYERKFINRELPKADSVAEIQFYVGGEVARVRESLLRRSQESLAKQTGLPKDVIGKLERGTYSQYDALEKVADAFGVPIYIFFPDYEYKEDLAFNESYKKDNRFGKTLSGMLKKKTVTNEMLAEALELGATHAISVLRNSEKPNWFARVYQVAQALQVNSSELCPPNRGASHPRALQTCEAYAALANYQKANSL